MLFCSSIRSTTLCVVVGSISRGVGIAPAQDVAGELDDHALHAEANTQRGDAVLTGIAQGDELPVDTAGAEARSYDDTINIP